MASGVVNTDQFEQYFKRADLDQDGRVSGAEAVSFFQASGLPKPVLAQVTYVDLLSDFDLLLEFCVLWSWFEWFRYVLDLICLTSVMKIEYLSIDQIWFVTHYNAYIKYEFMCYN